MPKLNITHLVGRIQERIAQLERDESLEARDFESLLNAEQANQYRQAWQHQKDLRTRHKPPKTEEKKQLIGWKTIREVRLEIYRQALQKAKEGLGDGMEEIQHHSEVKAARVFMDAFSQAIKEGKNAKSAGNIALRRNGFNRMDGHSSSYSNTRDKQVNEMEDSLRQSMESNLSAEEKEQLELSREYDKAIAKRRKSI